MRVVFWKNSEKILDRAGVIYYKKRFRAVLEMKKDKKLLLLLALVLVGALLFSVIPASAGENPSRGKSLAEARRSLERELSPLAGAGFVGIAHSEADGEITVFVEDEQAEQKVPGSFNGYAVRTEVTGKVQALSTQVAEPLAGVSPDRRDEVSPLPLVGGISLSAYIKDMYYAGTLGMVTYDGSILSNAHVIAINPETGEFLDTETPIIQPGYGDGGRLNAQVGVLEKYIPIDFDPDAENYADAAVGSIDDDVNVSYGEQFGEGGNYWIEGWTEVSIADTVRKSGRTTGVTTGQVINTNISVYVEYGDEIARFVDQIAVLQDNYSFAGPGDSGSAVDKDGEFVGLVFAGSENYAYISKAEHIIDGLGIDVEPQCSLTISSTPGGEVTDPGEGMFIRYEEQEVPLVAENHTHYHFAGWTGDYGDSIGNVTAAETTITMSDSYSITANFALEDGYYSLTTSSTEGGEVDQPGETQPGGDPFVYEENFTVDLVAVNETHYHFVEWTGNNVSTIANVTAPSTNITMNDSYSISANFALNPGWYSLTILSTDGGNVTEPGVGTHVYNNGTVVNLTAKPDVGYNFLEWTGNATSAIGNITAASTTITMNSSYSIIANFESVHPEPMALLMIASTRGGSVINPSEGTHLYPLGAEVSLVAEPDEGRQFVRWLGDVSTIANVAAPSTTITVDRPYSIIAVFSGGGGCFIATVAYGTPMAEEIQVLRELRDEYLLNSPVGEALVEFYYKVSPPLAEFITEHPSLKPIVRAGLLPAVALSTVAVNTTPVEKIAIVALLGLGSVVVAIWATRRRGRGPEYT
jgi:hypothetical protein